jgi:heme/copper-type cytochrome/quinol oxidase subunit 2
MEVVNTTTTTDPVNMYNYMNGLILNPIVFIIILLIIISYYVFSSSLNTSSGNLGNGDDSSSGSTIMGIIIIAILIVLIIINAFQYFFSISVTAYIQGIFSPKTTVDIVVDQSTYQAEPLPSSIPEIKFKKQVFNIPGNYYDYENANALCKAYGSDLASYDQIEKAYNNGAEWCNYGWSANQLALFPTQKQSYDRLQTIQGHENDCGRTGINGGYMANPKIKFGVNCYGYKPKITTEENELMKTSSPYPETVQDLALQKRIDFWKNRVDEILVSPFNYNNWGSF